MNKEHLYGDMRRQPLTEVQSYCTVTSTLTFQVVALSSLIFPLAVFVHLINGYMFKLIIPFMNGSVEVSISWAFGPVAVASTGASALRHSTSLIFLSLSFLHACVLILMSHSHSLYCSECQKWR